MDRNAIIGFGLIFLIILAWQRFTRPSEEQLAEQQRIQDSLARVAALDTLTNQDLMPDAPRDSVVEEAIVSDSAAQQQLFNQTYGAFAPAATGTEEVFSLTNDLIRVDINSKGGKIVGVELLGYSQIHETEDNKEVETPLLLLEDEKNKFEYLLPVAGAAGGVVSTEDLYFTPQQEGNTIVLRANAGPGRYFEQRYAIEPGSYNVDYSVRLVGLNPVLDPRQDMMTLHWANYLSKLEKNVMYERNYSTVYYKPADDDVDHCSCTSSDTEELYGQRLQWISHSNQFFNSTLIAETAFSGAEVEAVVFDEGSEDLKLLRSRISLPASGESEFNMDLYVGPNDFKLLQAYDMELEYIIPFGRSILGTINRWVIRPIFNFFSSFIGSMGLVILVLTVLIKSVLYPLSYRMLYSQAKMSALKPKLEGLKEKHKDEPQKAQMETMKVYQEHGVNPLGGCLPVLLQMPIWIALYRFFPASIEFRQESFLWASDLSSYDVAFSLPFTIPFYGDHVSLFTLLWAGTTVIYTYYNSQQLQMGQTNPAMKYIQYFMPLMFLFFFNNYASGLTCYLLFSNIFNIGQTIITKNYIIDHDKIRDKLEKRRKQPKKKSGFQARLQDALKEQQRQQEQRKGKGKKK